METTQSASMDFAQSRFGARFEWGIEGVRRLAPVSDVMVIVDVLSFSTAIDVAVSRGATVYPYRWRDPSAATFARAQGARLAVHRREVSVDEPFSLSPATLAGLRDGDRIVLPSPNGATQLVEAAARGKTVLVGGLRNASAVARAAAAAGGSVAVIAAGEHWPEPAGLRPAIEDLIGAGAILAALDLASPSPEAIVAIGAFRAVRDSLGAILAQCTSGRELTDAGFPQDIELAAELDVSTVVPMLIDGALVGLGW